MSITFPYLPYRDGDIVEFFSWTLGLYLSYAENRTLKGAGLTLP